MFMQATTDTVIVRGPDGEPITLNNVITLDTDFGLMIKGEDKVEIYTWENVLYRCWTDLKAREAVWAEALAEIIADAFEDEWDDEFEDEEEEPFKPKVKKAEPKAEEASDKDDPNVNPYSQ
jgi:hypothetical protein